MLILKKHVDERNLWKITNNDSWHGVSGLKIWRIFPPHIVTI